jgi:hypothetical protein
MFGQQPLNKGRQRSLIPLGRLARGLVDLFFVSLNFPAVVEWTGRSYIGRAMVRTIDGSLDCSPALSSAALQART